MAGEEHDGTMSERSRLQGLVRLTNPRGFVPGLGRDRGWCVPRVRVVSQLPLMAGEEHHVRALAPPGPGTLGWGIVTSVRTPNQMRYRVYGFKRDIHTVLGGGLK